MPAPTRAQISNPLVNTYRTQDGRFVSLCMLQSHRYWPGFCKVAERAELEHDPRFATAIDRARNVADCVAELDRLFAGRTRSEEHTSELQSLMRISYAVFCLKKKKNNNQPDR